MSIETNYMVIQGYTYKEWDKIFEGTILGDDWDLLSYLRDELGFDEMSPYYDSRVEDRVFGITLQSGQWYTELCDIAVKTKQASEELFELSGVFGKTYVGIDQ